MQDEQYKQELRRAFSQDIKRRIAIDNLVSVVIQKDLIKDIKRKYGRKNDYDNSQFWQTSGLRDTDQAESDHAEELRALLVEFYNSLSSNTLESTGREKLVVSDEAVDSLVREHSEEIGQRFLAATDRMYDKTWKPEPANRPLLDAPKLTTLSAINDWSSKSDEAPSLKSLSEKALMTDIRSSLEGAKASAAFCCGGSVAFRGLRAGRSPTCLAEVAPVTLRWDANRSGSSNVVFHQASSADPQFRNALEDLCRASEPASFGRGGETVFDESYRQATKLEPAQFATNFHPHDCGILSELERVLLPSYLGDKYEAQRHSIFAELYKLNVYSGPRGLFKPHVDTPRGETQFASLVVCLPSVHEGGALVLRHNRHSIEFDWSGTAPDKIQWAAFYSDCEHEVLPLVSGCRITLTYNLYYQITQPQPGHALPLSLDSVPLYHDLRTALRIGGFMHAGGILGFYCNHAYPHSNVALRKGLPMALKGVDLLIYTVCRSLGLVTKARPILGPYWNPEHEYDEDIYADYEGYNEVNYAIKIHKKARARLRAFQKDGFYVPPYKSKHKEPPNHFTEPPSETVLPEYLNPTDDPAKHPLAQHKLTLEYRRPDRDLRIQQDDFEPDDPEARVEYLKSNLEAEGLVPPHQESSVRIGSKFHRLTIPEYEIESETQFKEIWPSDRISGIRWVTERRHEQLALVCATYGNNAETSCKYSAAAILAVVPPWSPERGEGGDGTATFSEEGSARSATASEEGGDGTATVSEKCADGPATAAEEGGDGPASVSDKSSRSSLGRMPNVRSRWRKWRARLSVYGGAIAS